MDVPEKRNKEQLDKEGGSNGHDEEQSQRTT